MSAYDSLLEQIDLFIRKYYKNQMVKGLIWFVGIFLFTFLLVTTLEYFGRFGSGVRGMLLFGFIAFNGYVLVNYIAIPVLKLFSFGNRINRYQASLIIGTFFPNISDRLLNTLQLNDDLSAQEGNLELIRASVMQRAETLSIVPFGDAIQIKENARYLKYVIPVVLIFAAVGVFAPKLFSEGSKRVVNYNTVFLPEAPFTFNLKNYDSRLLEGESLNIDLVLEGTDLPEKVYVVSDHGKVLLKRTGRNEFTGELKKLIESGKFYFAANEFVSKDFHYSVYGRPSIGKFEATLHYPKYLGRADEVVNNAGDLTVPEGTTIDWSVVSKNTEYVKVRFGDSLGTIYKNLGFKFSKRFFHTTAVGVELKGNSLATVDSSSFTVNVQKDAFPSILVEEKLDTLSKGLRFFSGKVADDYGLTSLQFVYTVKSKDGNMRTERMTVRPVSGLEMPFDFGVDFTREKLKLEDRVEYYFVVSDNDGVHGSKTARSRTFVYELPNLEELNEKREVEQEKSKESLSDLMKRTEQFQKNVEKLERDLLNSKSSDWNKKNQINQLQNEQQGLLEDLKKTQQLMEQSDLEKEQLNEEDLELLEKQELLQDMMDKLMDDELKNLLEELEKLMEQNNKEELQKKMEDLQMSSEDMKKQLDRSLEMLKKLQVDEKIDGIEKELSELAKEQLDLKKKIESNQLSKEDAKNKQDEINKKFDELKEDLRELEKLNEELNRPMDLPDTKAQEESIENELNEAKDKLEKNKESKAGESQQSAAEQMQKMANEMDAAQQASNQQQQQEDIDMLRDILESLVALSFDQESVMNTIAKLNINDPAYKRYGRKQRSIADNTIPVRDSLIELAKRQPKIASFIDKELNTIESNHKLTMNDIDERNTRDLGLHQQLAMTSYNNLALMLNESLQQMQKQMQSMMPGSGACDKPGGKGSPKPGDSDQLGNMKEQLKKQLEQMQKGSNPNGEKPGNAPGMKPGDGQAGGFGMGNKEIAKMAAEQSAMRQKLEQLKQQLNKEGKGKGNQLNPLLNELEKQEEDLVNKRFSSEMIRRQKDILTRLLESEKALMERGFEDQRKSDEGKNRDFGNLIRFDEYNKQKLKQVELLRTIDPVYNKYYRDKASQYFNSEYE